MMFLKTVRELAFGQAVQDFDEALSELVERVNEHQKPGTFQLTMKFEPKRGQVIVEYDVKVKAPDKDRMATIMFVQDDGTLGRRDPRQPELPFVVGEEPAVEDDGGEAEEANNG